ncbi:PREDICTED: 30S ribosomal protein S6 alpha, chloroplastic [Tarenaya hassleriana]|uniref:30S ribosomal protein S6 alpha, chloroplastic n=1 Tax=Tarenaya hassleriana TaxID=28532 RepID=UPI00053CA564|nr:PREDICTED: 30S ribosomal protein S6 alpha, chloroplastic [Tarenaya hassleriana]
METMTVPSLGSSRSPICPQCLPKILSLPLLSFSHSLRPFPSNSKPLVSLHKRGNHQSVPLTVKLQALDFSGSFFEGGFGSDDDPASPSGSGVGTALEDKPEPQCPPGLRQYETMAVLRPDMSEDERLGLTQKYEELLVAGGGMYVEVFNRGVIPLAYSIRKKNKAGETNTYLDGIYLLFTYFTKPESIVPLEAALNADDDVIRSSSFKIRKRKY